MFKAFDLQRFDKTFINPIYREMLIEQGRNATDARRVEVTKALASIAKNAAVLDGKTIKDSWFPQVDADVMLSHSHRDEDDILLLAGWLFQNFGLRVFVDSAIWGFAGDLLGMIDKEYCYQPHSNTYNYLLRNESTSHVHMLLTAALGMMIHKTECLIFVNTPASIAAQEVTAQTFSPWIYAELTIAGIVERIIPTRFNRDRHIYASRGIKEAADEERVLKILHTVEDMSRLRPIDCSTLWAWDNENRDTGPSSLDKLYEIAASL